MPKSSRQSAPRLIALLALITIVLFTNSHLQASANLIVNGDFQTGDFSSWTSQANTMLHGYFTPTDNVPQMGPFNWLDASVWQSFPTEAGVIYSASFDAASLGARASACLTGASIYDGAGLAGSPLFSNTYATTNTSSFSHYAFTFTASSSQSTLLIFDAGDSDNYDNLIGNIAVSPLPEPSSLFGLSVFSLVAFRGRPKLGRRPARFRPTTSLATPGSAARTHPKP